MPDPYYADEFVQLYLGDCLEVEEWLAADVLVTDPPYGIEWSTGDWRGRTNPNGGGISHDRDASARDQALKRWGCKPALVFGSLKTEYPAGWKRMLVFGKPSTASGIFGNRIPWLTNWEPVFVLGDWPETVPSRSAIIQTRALAGAGYSGYVTRAGHPHAKPLDVMESLLDACPPGIVADPFAGSGSTLVASKALGRKAIGVELEERYCEIAANRLSQDVLDFGGVA